MEKLNPSQVRAIAALPIATASLPATYENAKNALMQCSKLDECQSWADKAAALASYARQADDMSLRDFAMRIQARAIRRAGELLKSIPDTNRGRPSNEEIREGDHTNLTRYQAAIDAGMSDHQRVTALRVASLSADRFDELVDGQSPPTVTAIAREGTKPGKRLIDFGDINPEDFKRATKVWGTLGEFAEFCRANDPTTALVGFMPAEIEHARKWVAEIDSWLDRFIVNLKEAA